MSMQCWKEWWKIIKKFYSRDICNDTKVENLVCTLYSGKRGPRHRHASRIMREITFSRQALAVLPVSGRTLLWSWQLQAAELLICHAKDLSWHSKNLLLVYRLSWQTQYIYFGLHRQMQITTQIATSEPHARYVFQQHEHSARYWSMKRNVIIFNCRVYLFPWCIV